MSAINVTSVQVSGACFPSRPTPRGPPRRTAASSRAFHANKLNLARPVP